MIWNLISRSLDGDIPTMNRPLIMVGKRIASNHLYSPHFSMATGFLKIKVVVEAPILPNLIMITVDYPGAAAACL